MIEVREPSDCDGIWHDTVVYGEAYVGYFPADPSPYTIASVFTLRNGGER